MSNEELIEYLKKMFDNCKQCEEDFDCGICYDAVKLIINKLKEEKK